MPYSFPQFRISEWLLEDGTTNWVGMGTVLIVCTCKPLQSGCSVACGWYLGGSGGAKGEITKKHSIKVYTMALELTAQHRNP